MIHKITTKNIKNKIKIFYINIIFLYIFFIFFNFKNFRYFIILKGKLM